MLEGVLAYVGLGSNLGDSVEKCKESMALLSCSPGVKIERISSFYKTEPVFDAVNTPKHMEAILNQNWYINAVAEIRTILSPGDLLRAVQEIEKKLGRIRTFQGAPRIIDLDLLLYGQEIIRDKNLMVPHPQMHKRLFVLEPLCEIASYLIHPVFGVSMRGLKDRLVEKKIVEIHKT